MPKTPSKYTASHEQRGHSRTHATADVDALSETEVRRLAHELEVHQIELQMQNEELKIARIALEQGLARYTELFDFAPIAYVTLDRDDKIRELNHAAAQLLGRERARLVGDSFMLFVRVEDNPRFVALRLRAQHSGTKQIDEFRLHRVGNTEVTVRATLAALDPSAPLVLLALEDVTERRAQEDLLRQTEHALRVADQRKDEFLAVLSHELRNPLTPIRNCIFMLDAAELPNDDARRARTILDRQVTHLTRLIDDLLDVTRIRRGKIELQKERVEFDDLVRRVMEDYRSSFEARGIVLVADLEAGRYGMEADPARLTQVLTNLLGNAEKFTPRNGKVIVSLQRKGDSARLRVSDSGVGIAAEVIESMFEPFVQAPQTIDRARGGLGLGLSMVKGLVELHGGEASISSRGPGLGTDITISLPLERPSMLPPPPPELRRFHRKRVLVIEDNVDAADTLSYALGKIGHDVQVAYDGQSGLDLAREFQPDIVLCDIGLPEMDGYEVSRAFRADRSLSDTYLVALSGYARPEDLQLAADAGFNLHVAKPPSMDRLSQLLAGAPTRLEHHC